MKSPIRLFLLTLLVISASLYLVAQGKKTSLPAKKTTPSAGSAPASVPGYYWKACGLTEKTFFGTLGVGSMYPQSNPEASLKIVRAWAKRITLDYRNWHMYVPPCPNFEANIKNHTLFTESDDFISCFHKTAEHCYRSDSEIDFVSEMFETLDLAETHAQQCCYAGGILQTTGTGAGTPDFVNSNYKLEHLERDVRPWMYLSLNEYHAAWPPNKGEYYPFRAFVPARASTHQGEEPFYDRSGIKRSRVITIHSAWMNTYLQVKKGDKVDIKVIKGNPNLGRGIIVNTANGIPKGSKEEQKLLSLPTSEDNFPIDVSGLYGGVFKRERLDDSSNFGALLVTLDNEEGVMGDPILVGIHDIINFSEDGYLFLAINDNSYDDNEGYFIVEIKKIK